MKTTAKWKRVRCCASCERVFLVFGKRQPGDCPSCHFGTYFATFVYSSPAYVVWRLLTDWLLHRWRKHLPDAPTVIFRRWMRDHRCSFDCGDHNCGRFVLFPHRTWNENGLDEPYCDEHIERQEELNAEIVMDEHYWSQMP